MFIKNNACLRATLIASLIPVFLTGLLFISCPNEPGKTDPVNAQHPSISVQPIGGNWNITTDTTFHLAVTASVTDGGALSYQWYKNTTDAASGGQTIGTDHRTIDLNKDDYTDGEDCYFYVVVTNTISDNGDGGTKTATVASDVVTVEVRDTGVTGGNEPDPLSISAQPTGGFWNVWLTSENASFSRNTASLTVTAADGVGELGYQWYVNSSNTETGSTLLTGKTSAALSLTAHELVDYPAIDNGTNYFYVVVTDETDTVTSDIVEVTLDGVATGFIGFWRANNYQTDTRTITSALTYNNASRPIVYVSFFTPTFGILVWYNSTSSATNVYNGVYIEQYDPTGTIYNYASFSGQKLGLGSAGWTSTSFINNSYASTATATLDAAIRRFTEAGVDPDIGSPAGVLYMTGLTPPYCRELNP
jgi:hypothetical protein